MNASNITENLTNRALSTDVLEIFVKPDVAQQRYMGFE